MTHFTSPDNFLKIAQTNNLLYVNGERHLLIPSSSWGFLQRDLVDNIGMNRMKTFFYRHGENTGIRDAKEIVKKTSLSLIEQIDYFIHLRSLKGYVISTINERKLEIENGQVSAFNFKGIWEDSFEAEQHIEQIGLADHPICYTLIGYASGAVSYILGERVFFKEHQCVGEGAPYCIWEGRLLSQWDQKEYKEFINNQEQPILKELQQSYIKLMDEKNNLSMVIKIDNLLTDSVIKGKDIEAILKIVERQTGNIVVVEDGLNQITYLQGISNDDYEPIKKDFQNTLNRSASITRVTELKHSTWTRLVTPIYVKEKIVGYCSFLYKENRNINFEVDTMILNRLSSICSIIYIQKKVELESTERMKGYLLEEILDGKYQSEQEIMTKTYFIDLDFTGGYYAIHLKYQLNEKRNPYLHNDIFENVTHYISEKEIRVLIEHKTDSLLLLLPQKQLGENKIESIVQELLTTLKNKLTGTVWLAGVSSLHRLVSVEVNDAFREAQTALRLSTINDPVTTFNELGILGLLIQSENKTAIQKIAQLTLGKLYEDLDQNKVELVKTLYTFLINGGNFEQTSEQLAISISGLRYRLTKITAILGKNFQDPQTRFELLLTLKALMLLEEGWLEIQET